MDARRKPLPWFFQLGGAIPIASQREDPAIYAQAFARARRVLDAGDLLCIFPEGALTRDGALGEFKGGVMKLLETHPVPVVPLALQNLWGSFFSRAGGAPMTQPFRAACSAGLRWWPAPPSTRRP